jgi:WD40 repeat protein
MRRSVILWLTGGALALVLASEVAGKIPPPPHYWGTLAFSPDGRTLANGHYDKVEVWDVATGKPLHTLRAHTSAVQGIAFSPDGRTVASAGFDGRLCLWDPQRGKLRQTLTDNGRGLWSVTFAPDGRTLAAVDGDGKVNLWEVRSGGLRRSFTGHGWETAIAFAPDGRTVASGAGPANAKVRVWDVGTGAVRSLAADCEIQSVAFTPDGKLLAAAGGGRLIVWDTQTGTRRFIIDRLAAPCTAFFTPDGKALFSAGGYDISLRDAQTGKRLWGFNLQGILNSAALSPDGKMLAVSVWKNADMRRGWDFEVALYDATNGKRLRPFKQ